MPRTTEEWGKPILLSVILSERSESKNPYPFGGSRREGQDPPLQKGLGEIGMKTCVIFGAAEFEALVAPVTENDLVIAADGGVIHVEKLGIQPDVILGDFDSLGYVPQGARVYPVEKDDTDSMLAVRLGLEAGCKRFLKWNKIIICTDADEDGYHIRTLILTIFYRLLPSLIKMGKVYIAESPLYEISSKSGIRFAYNEGEKAAILKEIEGEKVTIKRSKGLGENDPDMMNLTTMNPKSRRLIRINPEDEQATYFMFNTLLGDDLASRKEYISKYGAEFIDLADI